MGNPSARNSIHRLDRPVAILDEFLDFLGGGHSPFPAQEEGGGVIFWEQLIIIPVIAVFGHSLAPGVEHSEPFGMVGRGTQIVGAPQDRETEVYGLNKRAVVNDDGFFFTSCQYSEGDEDKQVLGMYPFLQGLYSLANGGCGGPSCIPECVG